MSLHELNKVRNIVSKAANAVFMNEKFVVGVLAVKAGRVAQANPHDHTCVAMSNFLSKRAQNPQKLFISRAELREVYSKLETYNNKFGGFFQEELGLEERKPTTTMKRDAKENFLMDDFAQKMGEGFSTEAYDAWSEQLGAALSSKSNVAYSGKLAKIAQRTCARELNSVGMLPKRVSVASKLGENGLLCQAMYETPKGMSAVLIPVHIKEGMVIPPASFLSTAGFVKINSENIQSYLKATAGKNFQANVAQLIKAVEQEKQAEVGPVEQIVRQAALKKGTPAVGLNNVLLQEIDPAHPEVKVAKAEAPEDVKDLVDHLNSQAGSAEFLFGRDAVEKGRKLVAFEVKKAGLSSPQVAVADSGKDSVTYAISVNNQLGFRANVKFAKKQPILPRFIVTAGSLYSFDEVGLRKLMATAGTDAEALAQTSPMYGIKPSELVDQVRQAVLASNFGRASDALHVLGQSKDPSAYRTAYDIFVAGLKGEYQEQKKCAHAVKRSTSQKLICSHTNLPVDQVYQDQHGNCRPLYRRGMEDSSTEGVSTITSRIYFE